MKYLKLLIPVLALTFAVACSSETKTETIKTETIHTAPAENADSKVKVKFDGDAKELQIETKKTEIELK